MASIRDLSLGRYPMLVNPAGLFFISVTYEENGETNRLIFSPHQGLIGLPSHFNDTVEEWFDFLTAATKSAIGTAPPQTLSHQLQTPKSSRAAVAMFAPLLLPPVLVVAFLVGRNFESQQTDLSVPSNGMSWTLLGGFGLLGIAGLLPLILGRSRSTLPPKTAGNADDSAELDPEPPAPTLRFGLHSEWARRFLAIAHLGFLGFLCNLQGFERAAGMFGFFGFIGVATFFEFWERHHHRAAYRIGAMVVGVVLTAAVALLVATGFNGAYQIRAVVVTRSATIDQGHFTFLYDVDCPAGWNVWLKLESLQHRLAEPDNDVPREPGVVQRYQAKLTGRGRARIPLEYLPTGDENLNRMRASFSGTTSYPTLEQDFSLLHYTTESLMRVGATLVVLPDGQSPDSQLTNTSDQTVRFVTIMPPTKPKLAPFEGVYSLGKVEIVALALQGSEDQRIWNPNGDVSAAASLFNHSGPSLARGKVIKQLDVRVRSQTNVVSNPIIRSRPESGVSVMGGSFVRETTNRQNVTVIQRLACRSELLATTFEVGVADGDWKTSLTFDRRPNQYHFGASTSGSLDGDWEGSVRSIEPTGDSVPLAFSYSTRDDHETRLVYERTDGTIKRLTGDGSDGHHGVTNSLTTLPLEEFESIKRFHVQSRRYEWIEFRNVSLQLGHHTEVEVQSAY